MKFNPNQMIYSMVYPPSQCRCCLSCCSQWFLVLVGQPSSVRADVVNPTPAQVVPDVASESAKSDLPVEVLKEAVDVALPSEQSVPTPKTSLDATGSSENRIPILKTK